MNVFSNKNLVTPQKWEYLTGLILWALYAAGLSLALSIVFYFFEVDVYSSWGDYLFQLCNWILMFVITLLSFRRFLWRNWQAVKGRKGLLFSTALRGLALYFLLNYVLNILIALSGILPENMNNAAVDSLLNLSPVPMMICTVLLVPVTEECLVRGVIFAPICKYCPWLAYVVTILIFGGLHVVNYIGQQAPALLLISFVQYLPASIVLGWAYQRTGSIFGSIALHSTINLIAAATLFML